MAMNSRPGLRFEGSESQRVWIRLHNSSAEIVFGYSEKSFSILVGIDVLEEHKFWSSEKNENS